MKYIIVDAIKKECRIEDHEEFHDAVRAAGLDPSATDHGSLRANKAGVVVYEYGLSDKLTPDEQLSLIAYLTQRLQHCEIKRKPRRDIMEFAGIAPNLMGGMDAQEYVRRILINT